MKAGTLITLLAALALLAAATDAQAQNLRPGATVRGQLMDHQSVDTYLVDLSAGDRVTFKVSGVGRGRAPGFVVLGPNSNQLAAKSGRRVNRARGVRVTATGPHQISIIAAPGTTLEYVLKIRGRRVAPYVPPIQPAPNPTPPAPVPAPPAPNPTPPAPNPAPPPPNPAPPAPNPTPPAPGGPGDRDEKAHLYLAAALLSGERGEDLARAAETIEQIMLQSSRDAIEALQAELEDPILDEILAELSKQGLDTNLLGRAGIERVLAVVDADRRSRAAADRRDRLAEAAAGTELDGDQAFGAGMSMAAGLIDDTRSAISREIRDSIPALARGGDAPAGGALDAPLADPSSENLAGRNELELTVMPGLMDRARGGDPEAVDLAMALYTSYREMLETGAAGAGRRREIVESAIAELSTILNAMSTPLELAVEAMPAPGPGQPFELLVKARGVEQSQIDWSLEGREGQSLEQSAAGLRITSGGESEDLTIVVRAALGGREGGIEITVELQAERKPLFEVVGRLLDAGGLPLAGARVELRAGHPEGEPAETPGGRALEAVTGADGRFSLAYAQDEPLWLAVMVNGEQREIRDVPAGIPAETETLNRIEMEDIAIR